MKIISIPERTAIVMVVEFDAYFKQLFAISQETLIGIKFSNHFGISPRTTLLSTICEPPTLMNNDVKHAAIRAIHISVYTINIMINILFSVCQ
jgi:hypothetical protein